LGGEEFLEGSFSGRGRSGGFGGGKDPAKFGGDGPSPKEVAFFGEVELVGHEPGREISLFIGEFIPNPEVPDVGVVPADSGQQSIRLLHIAAEGVARNPSREEIEEEDLRFGKLASQGSDDGIDPANDGGWVISEEADIVCTDEKHDDSRTDLRESTTFCDPPKHVLGGVAADPEIRRPERSENLLPNLGTVLFPGFGDGITEEEHLDGAFLSTGEVAFVKGPPLFQTHPGIILAPRRGEVGRLGDKTLRKKADDDERHHPGCRA